MPKQTSDIVEAASRCFHFNASMLVPDYIVIRSEKRNAFAVTPISLFILRYDCELADDWQIAINLSSENLMRLMGIIPVTQIDQPADEDWLHPTPAADPTPEIREVAPRASSPEDL